MLTRHKNKVQIALLLGGKKVPIITASLQLLEKMSNKEIEDPLINWVKSKTSAIDFCRGIKNSAEYSMRVSSVI
jgi:hypothetical protein